jgi:hypothetical protein
MLQPASATSLPALLKKKLKKIREKNPRSPNNCIMFIYSYVLWLTSYHHQNLKDSEAMSKAQDSKKESKKKPAKTIKEKKMAKKVKKEEKKGIGGS